MDRLTFLQYKLIQFFHDPPNKPIAFFPGLGGHRRQAGQVFRRFIELPERGLQCPKRPDWAASGADRPVLQTRGRGNASLGIQRFWNDPVVTHPLSRFPLYVRGAGDDRQPREKRAHAQGTLEDEKDAAEILGQAHEFGWESEEILSQAHVVLWRRFREEIVSKDGGDYQKGDLLWERMPADTRCPDHTIWEHLRLTTALNFMDEPVLGNKRSSSQDPLPLSQEKEPWLFTLSIGPVSRFIEASYSSRDLWIGSFLLADLIWHAMKPIVKRYGPDAILHPDLRENPRVDVWLAERDGCPEALPPYFQGNPSTFAATLPDRFTAVLPRGGSGHLVSIEEMAKECRKALYERWQELAGVVEEFIGRSLKNAGCQGEQWRDQWRQQHDKGAIYLSWTAVRWELPESMADLRRSGAFPGQRPDSAGKASQSDLEKRQRRDDRLGAWMTGEVWSHYEHAREVFGRLRPDFVQSERGFDYAPVHHQLRARQKIREKRSTDAFEGDDDIGVNSGATKRDPNERAGREQCTLCHRREALWDSGMSGDIEEDTGSPESHRAKVRKFWEVLDQEGKGEERLCAICTMKRYLVKADSDARVFNYIWAGPASAVERLDEIRDDDGEIRAPFPSTTAVAAQRFLEALLSKAELRSSLKRVIDAHKRAGIPRTNFARALPRLASLAQKGGIAEAFLQLAVQNALFPESAQSEKERLARFKDRQAERQKKALEESVLPAVQDLRREARESGIGPPQTKVAVIKVDADRMGQLLIGDPERVGARWRDALHPDIPEQLVRREAFRDAGWPDILEQPRLVGPALHAFISRALADFSHHVVPWVVEREFGGRLIYAGGDDVLALAPAEDALGIVARLQQLFRASWLVDQRHDVDPWRWRRRDWDGVFDSIGDRQRFSIPIGNESKTDSETERVDLFDESTEYARHVLGQPASKPDWNRARVLPMLGPMSSLSASIVYAHHKTPLRGLIRHANRLLDEFAKERRGGEAVALAHYSRGGVKAEITVPWTEKRRSRNAYRLIEDAVNAFKETRGDRTASGVSLPKSMPYKLREVSDCALAAKDDSGDDFKALLRGLVGRQAEGINDDMATLVTDLWHEGFLTHGNEPDRSVEGLLLCRALARLGEEDE